MGFDAIFYAIDTCLALQPHSGQTRTNYKHMLRRLLKCCRTEGIPLPQRNSRI
jgi:hypothetical protein